MKEVLLFAFNDLASLSLAKELEKNLLTHGISTSIIEKSQYSKPIGSLITRDSLLDDPFGQASLPPSFFADYDGPELENRLILMYGISRDEIDLVISICSKIGLSRKDFKAVLTKTNYHWNAISLARELAREHRSMGNL